MIFDSHAHYDSEQFDIDRDELLGSVLPQRASLRSSIWQPIMKASKNRGAL